MNKSEQKAFKEGFSEAQLTPSVLDGIRRWSKMMWESKLFNKKSWDGEDEIEASIQSFIRQSAEKSIKFPSSVEGEK